MIENSSILSPSCPRRTSLINTLYLQKAAFDKLNILKGFIVEKIRYIIIVNQIRIAIDEINLPPNKLYLAEVEFDTEQEMNTFSMPIPYVQEITDQQQYNGYTLAKRFSNSKLI